MFRSIKKGETVYDVLTVFDFDGIGKVSGQGSSDFDIAFYLDGDQVAAPSHSVSEIGSSGDYCLTVPGGFPTKGVWNVRVKCEYNSSIWGSYFQVTEHDVDEMFSVFFAGGTGAESVELIVKDEAHGNTVVADVLCNVWNEAETEFVTFGRSGVDGKILFSLDVGTYRLRLHRPGMAFDLETLAVPASGVTAILKGKSVSITPPSAPNLCRLFADFLTTEGTPEVGFRVNVTNMLKPNSSAGLSVVDRVSTYTSDSNGHVQFDAVQGSRLRIAFVGARLTRTVLVPEQPTANLFGLLGARPGSFGIVKAS